MERMRGSLRGVRYACNDPLNRNNRAITFVNTTILVPFLLDFPSHNFSEFLAVKDDHIFRIQIDLHDLNVVS